jgi:hypothetical protein
MTFSTFLDEYDFPGSIVLLEGKRNVLEQDRDKLVRLGKLLTEKSQYIQFRSGNAAGSDELFSEGVAAVDSRRLEVITPYAGHRQKQNRAFTSYPLDDINLAEEPEIISYTKQHPGAGKLVDAYLEGTNSRMSAKAIYLLRDTVKVTGTKSGIPSATFAIFYVDLKDIYSGGTGHTMKMCDLNNVPFVYQNDWMQWL